MNKRNAIVLAAGFSSRLAPLSLERPKALIDVKGEVLIERQVRQLKEAGIEEIIVVTGYKSEMFEYLKGKLGVELVYNPHYSKRNNHSSLYVARKYLRNTYICVADNYFTDNVFLEKPDNSYYGTFYISGNTDEWCVDANGDGLIRAVTIGGKDSSVMKGHAYFEKSFSDRLVPYIVETMASDEKKDFYWEDIYLEHIHELPMYKKDYKNGIIREFDSLEELREFDERYRTNSGSVVLSKICSAMKCREGELTNITPLKRDGKVTGITFKYNEEFYKYYYDNTAEIIKIS